MWQSQLVLRFVRFTRRYGYHLHTSQKVGIDSQEAATKPSSQQHEEYAGQVVFASARIGRVLPLFSNRCHERNNFQVPDSWTVAVRNSTGDLVLAPVLECSKFGGTCLTVTSSSYAKCAQPPEMTTIAGINIADLVESGELIEDAAEETFILFSQNLPHNDLGIIDNEADEVSIEVNDHDYSIVQSSGLLKSNRAAGTTGAVVWKVTPRIAQWLASKDSLLWRMGILDPSKSVLELGCGVAGIIGLALSRLVSSYVLTDQEYVLKLLKENIANNIQPTPKRQRRGKGNKPTSDGCGNLQIVALDWEKDSVENLGKILPSGCTIDVVVACDCIYNSYLIEPLTQTCVEICSTDASKSPIVVIAQQLRTEQVFEEWLTRFLKDFQVWRIRDKELPADLQSSSGYVVHMALLRSNGLPS